MYVDRKQKQNGQGRKGHTHTLGDAIVQIVVLPKASPPWVSRAGSEGGERVLSLPPLACVSIRTPTRSAGGRGGERWPSWHFFERGLAKRGGFTGCWDSKAVSHPSLRKPRRRGTGVFIMHAWGKARVFWVWTRFAGLGVQRRQRVWEKGRGGKSFRPWISKKQKGSRETSREDGWANEAVETRPWRRTGTRLDGRGRGLAG
ncbi:hypothetical protein LZ30DRAFT_214445 [Colletotrichum cereale]|nr:hypothetical protein LZ30DRAFT_214445 [Colletotrichum cereale]